MSASSPAPRDRASLQDWLAVGVGTLGGLMAMIDISIVNSSLPVIQGEIGATASEGTWIGTSYLVAEIVVIPLTAWLERLLGQRRLLLASATMFMVFSMVCGLSTSLEMMIFGRIGQGLAGGVLIPMALTITALRLPPRQQPLGMAMMAVTSLIGPAAGPVLGGWMTEHLSWHYAFFMNLPIWALQTVLLLIAIPASAGDRRELRNADWCGVAGLVIGLGAITTLLEEGHREHWFESPLIWKLAAASVVGFGLIAVGQPTSPRPVIRLSLLRDPRLGSAVALITILGMVLYSCLFMTPQFLAAVAGYSALQAGQIAFISGVASFPAAFLYPLLAPRVDARAIIATAMLFTATAAFLVSRLTPQSAGADFILTQMLFGVGTTLSAIPLMQSVISSASLEDMPEANSLSSVARNLGGALGLAAIASFQDQRLDFHHWRLHDALSSTDLGMQAQIAEATAAFGGGPEGLQAAYRALDGQLLVQALTMTFNDMFLAMALIGVAFVPFVLLLAPSPSGAARAVVH